MLLEGSGNVLIELFGYRDPHFNYHPCDSRLPFTRRFVANVEIIHDIFDPVVNRDGAAYIGDPNRHLFSKQSMVRYLNNGLRLLDQLIAERHYSRDTVSRITALEEKEPLVPANPLIKKDSSYERRLAKVELREHDDAEHDCGGRVVDGKRNSSCGRADRLLLQAGGRERVV